MIKRQSKFILLLIILFINSLICEGISSSEKQGIKTTTPTIVIINTNLSPKRLSGSLRIKSKIQEIAPETKIYIIHFLDASKEKILSFNPGAIILSPQGTPWWQYPKKSLLNVFETIRTINVPILGICGGHQLLALAYNAKVAPIRRFKPSKSYIGCWREYGFTKIMVLQEDPIFSNCRKEIVVFQSHYEEVKEIPKGFKLLAIGKNSKIQAIKHINKPLYGVQFHPEIFNKKYMDGKIILTNFLKLAGVI